MIQINNTRMLEMMRGTPPPTWEQTCLKLSEEKRELQSDVNELKELVEYLRDKIKRLENALLGTIDWITETRESGDVGYRAASDIPEVIAAKAALQSKEVKP